MEVVLLYALGAGLVLWGLHDLVIGLWHLVRALMVLLFGVIPTFFVWMWGLLPHTWRGR